MTHANENDLPKGKVIVAGCAQGGLSIMRTLSKRGIHIIGLSDNPDEFGLKSRHVDEIAIGPHPRDKDAFVDFLLSRADQWRGALILETTDYHASALASRKDELIEHYRMVTPDPDMIDLFLEKDKTYELADRAGVLHPKIFHPKTMEEFDAIADQIMLPAMVKPIISHEFNAYFRTKLFTADTIDELRSAFERTVEAGFPVIVSEIIPGDDYKTLERVSMYIDSNGEICAEMYNVKLRQTPPMFGVNRVSQTTPLLPDVREEARKLMAAANYRGQAGIEFKRDPRDNKLKLIEVNIRFLADNQLAISAGIDFAWMMYQDLVEGQSFKVTEYKAPVYYIHLVSDLFDILRHDENRGSKIRRYLEPYLARRKTFPYLSLSDPKPFFAELPGRIKRFRRKQQDKTVQET